MLISGGLPPGMAWQAWQGMAWHGMAWHGRVAGWPPRVRHVGAGSGAVLAAGTRRAGRALGLSRIGFGLAERVLSVPQEAELTEPVRKRPRPAERTSAVCAERDIHPLLTEDESRMQDRVSLERRATHFELAKRTLEGV